MTETVCEVQAQELYTVAQAAELLSYRQKSAVYHNPNLVLCTDERGRACVTKDSVREFVRLHEKKNRNWVLRDNSLTDEGIDKLLEKAVRTPRRTRLMLDLFRECNDIKDVAEALGCTTATVRHNLELYGVYSAKYVKEQFPDLNAVKSQPIPHVRKYPKDEVRLHMLEAIVSTCTGSKIQYLGLEGPHFCSFIDFASLAGDQLDSALFAEQDERSYHVMDSILRNRHVIRGGEIFRRAHVDYGKLRDVLAGMRKSSRKFNVLNLDYEGSICQEKMDTFTLLFEKNLLDDHALMVVTLNDSAYMCERVRRGHPTLGRKYAAGFQTNDQEKIMYDELSRLGALHGFEVKKIHGEKYKCRQREMATFVYELRRTT